MLPFIGYLLLPAAYLDISLALFAGRSSRPQRSRARHRVCHPRRSHVGTPEVEKDSVGKDRVEGPCEVIAAHVQYPSLMSGLLQPFDERRRRVGAVDRHAELFEVQRLQARTAAKLEHFTSGHVFGELVEKSRDRLGDSAR